MKLNTDALEVSNADEAKQNPDGSPAVDRWSFADPDQLGKFMVGAGKAAHPCRTLSKGDKTAAADMANDFRKQRES